MSVCDSETASLSARFDRRERLRRLKIISKGSTQTANSDALYEDAGYYYIPFKAYKNGSTMARAVFNIFLQESRSYKLQKLRMEVERLETENTYYKNVNEALVNHMSTFQARPCCLCTYLCLQIRKNIRAPIGSH